MKKSIDISNYEGFLELQKNQIECDSYLNILLYLLNKEYDVTNPTYKYYEEKYLSSYFELFNNKELLSNYLINNYKLTSSIKWSVNFPSKTVDIEEG